MVNVVLRRGRRGWREEGRGGGGGGMRGGRSGGGEEGGGGGEELQSAGLCMLVYPTMSWLRRSMKQP